MAETPDHLLYKVNKKLKRIRIMVLEKINPKLQQAFVLMLSQSFVNLSQNKINDLKEEGVEELIGELDEGQMWLIQSISVDGLINIMSEGGYSLNELSVNDLEININ